MEAKRQKPLTSEQIEELADRIYKLFKKNDIWRNARIFFNGNAIDNKDENADYHYDGSVYFHWDMNPRLYFEHVNPDHILSMSFDEPIYHMFHYKKYKSVLRKFNELLTQFGLRYEFGDMWNLTCYYAD